MTRLVHPVAGALALLTILSFWLSTALVELFGTIPMIVLVKQAIPWGFLLLVPSLAIAGGSGMALNRGRTGGLGMEKKRRMPFIAANGILILAPAAFFLAWKAGQGQLDAAFYAVQIVELLAGAVNVVLLGLNMRDGLRMTGRIGNRRARRKPA
ncbi:hypothetical protein B7H23_05780 [Notoacmeibacter marinus]|uniref:Uncharacterized protein n=1 Tax=Notoacmeibacter marinus TaxID=1876515 RepID=A0A231V2P1_9HYPH|nr:hypothetical protein [Notoacmeibacter marinus]OXT02407.1 hypothetical protein B7H23_05780 [Notoacmeibacter marinus]